MVDGYWACFTGKNSKGVYGVSKKQINLTKPDLTLLTEVDKIKVSPTNNLDDIKYFTGQTIDNCSSSLTNPSWTAGSITGQMTDGHWACFTGKNSLGVYGFGKKQINLSQPDLILIQNGDKIKVALTNNLGDIKYFTGQTIDNCSSSLTNPTWTSGRETSSMTDGHWACFTGKNSNGVYGFGKKQIDLTEPDIALIQLGDKIELTTTNNLGDIKYFTGQTIDNCSSSLTSPTWTKGSQTGSLADNYWACFTGKNSKGVYGFGKKQIDLTKPTLTLVQDGDKIKVSPTNNLGDIKHFTDRSISNCSETLSSPSWVSGSTTNSLNDDDWVCFTARNEVGVYGFGKKQIDLAKPDLILIQEGNKIKVDLTNSLSGFKYFTKEVEPTTTCAVGNAAFTKTGSTTAAMTDGHWACFTAKNPNGVYNVAKLQIDLNAPIIIITQSGMILTASTTATDLPKNPVWQKSGPNNSTDCDSQTVFVSGRHFVNAQTDKHYCFAVADKFGNVGYAEIVANPNAPTIAVNQSQSLVSGLANVNGGVAIDVDSWGHYVTADSTSPVCGPTDTNIFTTGRTQKINSSLKDRWVCFRVSNINNITAYAKHQLDYTPPIVTVVQSKLALRAEARDDGVGMPDVYTWSHTTAQTNDPTCKNLAGDQWSFGQVITSAKIGYYYCFRVNDKAGNIGYGKKQVSTLDPPILTVVQDGQKLKISPTAGLSDFRYFIFSSKPKGESPCDTSTPSKNFTQEGDTTTDMTVDQWVCFRAKKDINGVYNVAEKQIDLNPPIVDVDQSGSTLTASTKATDLPATVVWKNSGEIDSDPNCQTHASYPNSSRIVTNAKSGKYYCFAVTDAVGNTGYGKILVNLTPPTIILVQDGATIKISPTEGLSGAKYFTSPSEPTATCVVGNAAFVNNGYTTAAMTDGHWACFTAKDSNDIYNVASLQISLTKPTISLVQDGNKIKVSPTNGLSDFKYFTSPSEPTTTCVVGNAALTNSGQTTTAMTDGHWACFTAANSNGVYNVASLQISLTKPTISLVQDGNKIKVSPANGLSDFKYFTSPSEPTTTCVVGNAAFVNEGYITTAMTDGHWACFTAKNSLGVYNTASVQISLTKPTISLVQEGNKIKVSPTNGLSDIKYFTSSSDPNCSETLTNPTWVNGHTTTAMTAGSYACFTGKNEDGVYGFGQRQINLATTNINLVQEGNKIKVAPTNGLSDFKHFTDSSKPTTTCVVGNAAFVNNGHTTAAMTDGYWACFTAKNSNGIYNVASLQISLTKPTISLVQEGNKIKISPTNGLSDFKYFTDSSEPTTTCQVGNAAFVNNGHTTAAMTDNHWACFTAKNEVGVSNVASLQISLTKPTISLVQEGNKIKISPTNGLSDFKYFTDSV